MSIFGSSSKNKCYDVSKNVRNKKQSLLFANQHDRYSHWFLTM